MPKPRPLTPGQAKSSLAARFGPRADNLRQLATRFGIRPYRVFLVHEQWPGEERGEGDPARVVVISNVEILPSPRVKSLDSIALSPTAAGILPMGSLRLTRVSTTFTSDQLMGAREDGSLPDNVSFFYEVVEDGRGDNPAVRRKFRLSGTPHLEPGNVEWQLVLERISEDRDRTAHENELP